MTALVTQYTNVVPSGTKQRGTRCQLGTTAENDAYTGTAGELTFDTDLETLRVHDGVTAGGGTSLGVQGGSYGTIMWLQDEQEATELSQAARGPTDGPPIWGTDNAPRQARGVTQAVLGGAGRTNARNVTQGTDGTLTFTGNRTRAMLATAAVSLSHADPVVGNTCGLHLYRNGSPVPGAFVYGDITVKRHGEQAGTTALLGRQAFAISAVVEMKPNDTVSLWLSNQSGKADVTLESGTFTLHSL